MAKATRFDLSRLEGCTGTVGDSPVAVPHSLRPALAPLTESTRPRREPPTAVEPEDDACHAPAQSVRTEPTNEAAPPTPSRAVTEAEADRASPRSAPPAPPRAVVHRDENATPPADEPHPPERVRVGVILALTLSAWIPVLLIWWSRIG